MTPTKGYATETFGRMFRIENPLGHNVLQFIGVLVRHSQS